jgi:hypothetical protein
MDELSTPQVSEQPSEASEQPAQEVQASPWESYDPATAFKLPESRQDERPYFDALFNQAKELNLDPKQAEALAQFQLQKQEEFSKQWQEQEVKQLEETKAVLQKEWGEQYAQRLNRIDAFLKAEASPSLYDKITTTAMGQDKDVLLLLDTVAERLSGGKYLGSQGSPSTELPAPTMREAWQQSIAKNPEYAQAILSHTHPQYQEAKSAWQALAKLYEGKS